MFEFIFTKCFVKKKQQDFAGGPVVRTPCFHCQGRGFSPLGGELRSRKPQPHSFWNGGEVDLFQTCAHITLIN